MEAWLSEAVDGERRVFEDDRIKKRGELETVTCILRPFHGSVHPAFDVVYASSTLDSGRRRPARTLDILKGWLVLLGEYRPSMARRHGE